MLSFLKSSKNQIPIISNNRILGLVPAVIAQELVKTNHANIVNRKPVVIGLTQTKTRTQPVDAKHTIKNAATKRRRKNT